jgi:hypothetical protein
MSLFRGESPELANAVAKSRGTADVALTAQAGDTGQSANIFEVKNSAGTVVASISNAGVLTGNTIPVTVSLVSTLPATAANYGNFFIADRAYQITAIRESHTVAGSDAGAVSLEVEKLTGTQALDSGVTTQAAVINLKGTANTVQSATLSATAADLLLAAGDRLALKDTGTLTAVAGLTVTVSLKAV